MQNTNVSICFRICMFIHASYHMYLNTYIHICISVFFNAYISIYKTCLENKKFKYLHVYVFVYLSI